MASHVQEKVKKPVPTVLLTVAIILLLALTAWGDVRPSQTSEQSTTSVVSKPGPAGPKGAQGIAGVGSVGATGQTGKAGASGKSVTGDQGVAGQNGSDGANGLSVTAVTCNPDSSWTFTMSDGTALQASGPCMGNTGEQGPQGPPISGFSFSDMYGFRNTCVPSTPGNTQFTCTNS